MKKAKKCMIFAISAFMLYTNTITTFAYTEPIIIQKTVLESQYTQYRYPIIEWRYKVVDGALYKCQFNTTTGDWILCP